MQLSDGHKKNLKKLAKYLHKLPDNYEHFHMADYSSVGELVDTTKEAIRQCGTTACALGHGPAAGIKPSRCCNDWTVYSESKFGLITHGVSWDWCFGPSWKNTDDTAHGAAKRIMYMLEHDVPSYHNYEITVYENYTPNFEEAV